MPFRISNLLVIALGGIFLLLAGLRPESLPFMPEARFSDAAVSHWPAALHFRQSIWTRGEYPVWQETILGGGPFAANPLNKTAYPLQWLALLIPSPALFLNAMIVLHLFLAGWGMWRWMRALDLPESAALLSAVAYTFAPKLIAHTGAGHLDLLYALAWFPWLMQSVVAVKQTASLRRVAQIAVFAALLFLADVRLSLFALSLAAVYGLLQVRRPTQILAFVPALLLFAIFTLSATIPLLLWQPYLNRADITQVDAGLYSLEVGNLIGLLLPPHGGNAETMVYLSLPVLVLALIAVISSPRRHLFWIVMITLALLYALGLNAPLWPLLTQIAPGLLWFRVPSRAWFVVTLAACVLAGYGLQIVVNAVERLRQGEALARLPLRRLALAGWIGASLFCGGFTLAVLTDLDSTIGLGVAGIGGLLGLLLLLALYGGIAPERLAALLILLTLADLGWTGRTWLEWRAPDRWLTHQAALVAALQSSMEGANLASVRIYSPNYALEQQVAAANGLRLFYGVDPFQVHSVVEAIEQASGIENARYSVIQPSLPPDVQSDADIVTANCDLLPDYEKLGEWGVWFIVTTCPLPTNSSPMTVVDGVYVYRNPGYVPQTVNWPVSSPDATQIARLNNVTIIAALVSGLSFITWVVWLLWKWRKHA